MNNLSVFSEEVFNEEVFKNFIEAYTPTEADLNRKLNNEQLRELCLRVPCRVDMWKWNNVQDYVERFEREGRLQNKSRRDALKLLAKAVNRHKKTEVYTDVAIKKGREVEWRQRKKDMLMRLDLWEYEREQASKPSLEAGERVTLRALQHDGANITSSINEDLFEHYINIGSESVSYGTQSVIDINSENVCPNSDIPYSAASDYDEFNRRIPLTSTQSQDKVMTSTQAQDIY